MEKRRSGFLLESRFFGLTPNYKFQVYQEIHDLVYYGNGGFIYSEVYVMPIHIRRYHIKKINDLHEKRNEEEERAMNTSKENMKNMPSTLNINRP
tara:strand:+ start:62 stop:346 length:285 start_codon:yes stop_codon:yes gene_type:complete